MYFEVILGLYYTFLCFAETRVLSVFLSLFSSNFCWGTPCNVADMHNGETSCMQ